MDYLQFQELYHHGIKGQKWGLRRYTNEDGTLTESGKARYRSGDRRLEASAKANRRDAEEMRKAASKEKNEKTKRDLLSSADALDKLAERQEKEASEKFTRKKASEMSDEDLRKSSNRLQAEQTYERLSETKGQKAAKKSVALGASVVGSFILGAGGSYAYSAIESKSLSIGKDKVAKALLVGGLTAATALVTGAVATAGGQVTQSVEDKYYPKKKKKK